MKKKWQFITDYPVKKYACGLVAGQKLRLIKNLTVKMTDPKSNVLRKKGELWEVLPGAKESTSVVWLRQPDGKRHTWDDSSSIYEFFEIVAEKGVG